ncbi:hypothetical protein PIB30_091711 [Stylosanthes scabra]|uniref:Uncharacterized protein n=1 Tax=Stylosanthes scabra TaxID=79078 RepID=A0ABU6RV21_9FABA|nr:hypothetical protein [Stylosanthes scabra]
MKNKMPKKAIVTSSRGKGLRLALPGPIKQSQSAQKSGSSTQQSSKESSTQQSQSQSTQQAKQTKADYTFPIQTLMALQDQGVTKINKKSWAEICSESDEEIDLTQLITQVAKQKTIIPNPQEKSQKISDPETASFLNQKAQIQAALAGLQSKQSIKGKLKQILHLLQEDEEFSPNEESDQECENNPNEDDCFGINLDDD